MAKKSKRPTWFKLYSSNRGLVEAVPVEAAGQGLRLALAYFETGELPTIDDPLTLAVFNTLRASADEAIADYAASVEAGKAGAAERWGR